MNNNIRVIHTLLSSRQHHQNWIMNMNFCHAWIPVEWELGQQCQLSTHELPNTIIRINTITEEWTTTTPMNRIPYYHHRRICLRHNELMPSACLISSNTIIEYWNITKWIPPPRHVNAYYHDHQNTFLSSSQLSSMNVITIIQYCHVTAGLSFFLSSSIMNINHQNSQLNSQKNEYRAMPPRHYHIVVE